MPPSSVFFQLFRFLLPPALIGTVYLYTFPLLQDCGFPSAKPATATCYFGDQPRAGVAAELAPFRLLAIGDPQLEGDTSLPDPDAPVFPSLSRLWNDVRNNGYLALTPTRLLTTSRALATEDVPTNLQAYRKRLDLLGNDFYLAHVYSMIKWYSDPTHVVVLGDLLGSQWISDGEFAKRSDRFWNRVFRGSTKVPKSLMESSSSQPETLNGSKMWKDRIIAVAGNHDVGYAGDVTPERVERFERAFGNVNWEITFSMDGGAPRSESNVFEQHKRPELRLVVLNSMNLDGPAQDEELQSQSHEFLLDTIVHPPKRSSSTATIVLTHIPLHKKDGVCVDGPLFNYWPDYQGGGLREQNHLAQSISSTILDGLVGPNREHQAIILNGHDHEGCQTYHWTNDTQRMDDSAEADPWDVRRYNQVVGSEGGRSPAGVREITVRSIMGSYGGNIGFLSAWWDVQEEKWRFEYNACMFGVQHIWWAIYVVDILVAGLGIAGLVCQLVLERSGPRPQSKQKIV